MTLAEPKQDYVHVHVVQIALATCYCPAFLFIVCEYPSYVIVLWDDRPTFVNIMIDGVE